MASLPLFVGFPSVALAPSWQRFSGCSIGSPLAKILKLQHELPTSKHFRVATLDLRWKRFLVSSIGSPLIVIMGGNNGSPMARGW